MPTQRAAPVPTLTDLLFDRSDAGLCLVAPDGMVLRANPEWLRSAGFSLDEVIGAELVALFPDTRDTALAMHARALAGHHVKVPRHAQRIDGRETWWEGCIDPVPMEGGTGLLITAREVPDAFVRTARRLSPEPSTAFAPERLPPGAAENSPGPQHTSERAIEILESISDACASLDRHWRYTYVNRRAAEILGKKVEELIGQVPWEIFPFMVGSEAYRQCHRAMAEQAPVQFLTYEPTLDRWYENRLFPCEHSLSIYWTDVTDRKRMDAELRAIEERFRAFFQTSAVGVAEFDVDGRFSEVNERLCQFTGYSREELLRMEPADLTHPDDRAREKPILTAYLRGETTTYHSEKRYVRKDGSVLWVEVAASLIRDASGKSLRSVGIIQDITERKRAEEEVAVVTRLYAVLSKVNEAIVRTRNERLLFEEVCRIVAEDGQFPLVWVGQVEDRNIVPVTSSGSATAYLREMRVEVDGDLGSGPTGTCVREDHSVINDDFDINPTTWPWREATAKHGLRASAAFPLHRHGVVIGAITFYAARVGAFTAKQVELLEALCADISYALDAMRAERLRNEAENAVRESDERFRAAFEASPDAININRMRDGVYVMVNEGFTRLSGWTRREVIGRTAVELGIWTDPEQRRRMLERWGAGELIQSEEAEFRKKDGSILSAAISAQTFEAGGEKFLLAITRDVSDVKRVEAALLEADRRKDEFLAMLSHELRNPLAPIRNAAYLLEHAEPAGEQAERARGVLRRQSEHLTRLVDDLLDVTRITRGKISLHRSRIDLRDAVARAADDFRSRLAERGVAYRIALPETEVWTDADPTRLNQAVTNLLHNAAKFTRRCDEVGVSLHVAGSTAEIHVRDTGAGIDASVLPHIFEPFVQAERTLARSEGGLGLGLALVKGIVELHGGEVRAESAGIGRGTEFIVSLPVLQSAEETASKSGAIHAQDGGRRVLVVDDNRDAAESLADILRMLGHTVKVAYDGPTALERIGSSTLDVVFCDIGLPGMSGHEVATAVRGNGNRGLRLVALSGYAQAEDVKRAMEAGFDAHVAKPPDPDELARLLA